MGRCVFVFSTYILLLLQTTPTTKCYPQQGMSDAFTAQNVAKVGVAGSQGAASAAYNKAMGVKEPEDESFSDMATSAAASAVVDQGLGSEDGKEGPALGKTLTRTLGTTVDGGNGTVARVLNHVGDLLDKTLKEVGQAPVVKTVGRAAANGAVKGVIKNGGILPGS